MKKELGYESADICKSCGGSCCKSKGCSLSPEDMLREWGTEHVTKQMLEERLPDSPFAIDHFALRGQPFYYLRMRHKCFTFIGVDAMGECIAFTESGCDRTYENRPKGGRFLEGRENRQCEQHYTQEMMVSDWSPYQKLLGGLWERFYARFEKDGAFDRCEEAYMQWQRKQRERVP